MCLIVSAVWDEKLSDLSYNSRIPIWFDALPKMVGRQNGQKKLQLIVLVRSLTIFYWLIPTVSQTLAGPIIPRRSTKSKTSEVKKRTKKTRKWCHTSNDLWISFTILFTLYFELLITFFSLRTFTYHGNLIGKSRIACL